MALSINNLVIDCTDPESLARFWGNALDLPVHRRMTGPCLDLPAGNQPSQIIFQRVEDSKQAKNRLHVDVRPTDGTLAAEIRRLESLGARIGEKHRVSSYGIGWVVMADPEGNEFCVESSEREVEYVRRQLDGFEPADLDDTCAPELFNWEDAVNAGITQSATVAINS
jgi:predicted enzyme related to lactoylglutathione lyase